MSYHPEVGRPALLPPLTGPPSREFAVVPQRSLTVLQKHLNLILILHSLP